MTRTARPGRLSPSTFAGLHLAGPNANKTTLAVLSGVPLGGPLKLEKLYEKIGALGTLFSDERLVEILGRLGPFAEVFVDCPLTVPPCVACQRPVCPGAVQCDDVGVAYMLAVSARLRARGARKARPVNPQSQRLWDVLKMATAAAARPAKVPQPEDDIISRPGAVASPGREPSYSANHAPLVARARTLQRRLNAVAPRIQLKETSVAEALEALAQPLGLPARPSLTYRSFERGLDVRQAVIERLIELEWLAEPTDPDLFDAASRSVEAFHAVIAGLVAALHYAGMTDAAPEGFAEAGTGESASQGWVHLPVVAAPSPQPLPPLRFNE